MGSKSLKSEVKIAVGWLPCCIVNLDFEGEWREISSIPASVLEGSFVRWQYVQIFCDRGQNAPRTYPGFWLVFSLPSQKKLKKLNNDYLITSHFSLKFISKVRTFPDFCVKTFFKASWTMSSSDSKVLHITPQLRRFRPNTSRCPFVTAATSCFWERDGFWVSSVRVVSKTNPTTASWPTMQSKSGEVSAICQIPRSHTITWMRL